MTELSIGNLLKTYGKQLGLHLLAGEEGLHRTVNTSDTSRPSLALTGFVEVFNFDCVQVLGNHEIEYLLHLPEEHLRQALGIIYQFAMPCVVITGGKGRVLPELLELANQYAIPLLKSDFDTPKFNHLLYFYLDDVFAPQVILHATLVDVNGIGLLFTGRSAIGKSELGLDLVERGHRLVADDTVNIARKAQGILVGQSPAVLQDHMEIRGIGIINVKRMFGIRGTRKQKRVEVIVNLEDWNENFECERLGLDDRTRTILGVELPEITVPLVPGKNITVIAETIALNHLLRLDGYHPAQEFSTRLLQSMQRPPTPPPQP